ncbi:hypothetical protein SEA_GILGAMESH_40 [Streptomyces phage Gilgamesh]|uniref:Uncharacterized protein n=1 Tax=Streptomyces phage Gilgamesh TaxID=2599890 RepID=A0A5J6TXL3_9CAUD|nr:hypothetical protein QEH35_gp040 [Streptomyces phage Gilgamesh]QFG13232.1 hypothetical protein SEA_GILGAMESH_40 [Streptomyces phage Gilgamesh]
MLERTNLGWPETPFGSVTSPVQKPGTWLTGVSLLWGEAGDDPVLMGAGVVLMKIHRTQSLPVSAPLINFGYRVLLPEALGETQAIVQQLDVVLVQARRKAQILAWHNGADDLHVLRQLPRAEGEPRHPGVTAIADAWKDRTTRERGTVRCVDTSHDLGPAGLISDTAAAHGLEPLKSFAGEQQQASAQEACEALAENQAAAFSPDALAGSVLSSALATALLGGKHTDRLHWEEPLNLFESLSNAAWEAAPSLLGGVASPRSE